MQINNSHCLLASIV